MPGTTKSPGSYDRKGKQRGPMKLTHDSRVGMYVQTRARPRPSGEPGKEFTVFGAYTRETPPPETPLPRTGEYGRDRPNTLVQVHVLCRCGHTEVLVYDDMVQRGYIPKCGFTCSESKHRALVLAKRADAAALEALTAIEKLWEY